MKDGKQKTYGHMVGIRMIQKTRKRKYQLIPELGTTSRLTVPGPHRHPSTPKLRPKRCVETSGDPWDISQPPGFSLPVYGTPPTANGWYLHLALPSGNNHCRSVTFPMRIEPRGHDKAGRNPGDQFRYTITGNVINIKRKRYL